MAHRKYSLLIHQISQDYYTFDECVHYYTENFQRDVFNIFWFPKNMKTLSTTYGWTHIDILFTEFLGSKLFHTVFKQRPVFHTVFKQRPEMTPDATVWWIALFSWHRSMIQLLSYGSPFCDRREVRKQIIIFLDERAPHNFFGSEFFMFEKENKSRFESRVKRCQDG